MRPVVRLSGKDSDVRQIGREAVKAMDAQPQAASALFARLWSLHQRRRSFVSTMSAQQRSPGTTAAERVSDSAYRALWGSLLGIGLTTALVSAVMLGPSDRKNAFMNPELAGTIALLAGTIAIPVLLVAFILRVPDPQSARVAETLSVLVGLMCAGTLIFRLAAGTGDDRGFSPETIAWWLPMTAVTVLLTIGIAVRSDGKRRASAGPVPRGPKRTDGDDLRQLRRDAEWASSVKADPAMRSAWVAALDALGEHVDPAAIAQARTMTPAAWLAWMSYDGEIDIAGVIPRR